VPLKLKIKVTQALSEPDRGDWSLIVSQGNSQIVSTSFSLMKKMGTFVGFNDRSGILTARQSLKMARSAHAYVRGNTRKFYEWLETSDIEAVPHGPAIWICGDCHVGNLGPIANTDGHIDIPIRDLDQTVIGNPAHDLIRLALSLATAVRGSDLPGVTTAKMLETMVEGYEEAFAEKTGQSDLQRDRPESVQIAMRHSLSRSWKQLDQDRIEDIKPEIPLGKRFWPLSQDEKREIKKLFEREDVRRLVTSLRSRDDQASITVLDAAYWVKGCSSLGRLRFAVVLGIGTPPYDGKGLCLMDIKEAIQGAVPRYPRARLPRDNAERVVEDARHLAPTLGQRMLAARLFHRPVFLRELLPQDLQLEIEHLTRDEAMKAAHFLAAVVGHAQARQMDVVAKTKWQDDLKQHRSRNLDAPSWLWSSIVELVVSHEGEYLEHCRKYAMIPVES
jgi:uncharacterized protein (DUF2252 family)